ncbi:NUDIX hydrolase [Glutamicibacter sp. BW78]|uniref:NUDIX hydrolase n=1 Tax=Glutamicibacter sp. BW78 TaxID=2024403 RepID=UPI0013040CA9|nr:NUDIX hydrolase [Glutamicibacter sp. BW78]
MKTSKALREEHDTSNTALQSVLIHADRFSTIRQVPFTLHNGKPGRHIVVTAGSGRGVVIVPVVNVRGLNYFCVVDEYRLPVGQTITGFPRGGTDPHEEQEDAARRELREETGIEACDLVHMGSVFADTGILDTKIDVYFAQAANIPTDHVDPETGGTSRWIAHGQLGSLIHSGKMRCGLTLAALSLVEHSGRLR